MVGERMYCTVVSKHPEDQLKISLQLGQVLSSQGRYEEAINIFEQSIAQGEDLDAYYYLREAQYYQLKVSEAWRQYLQARDTRGTSSFAAYRHRGLVFLSSRQYKLAIDAYSQALEWQDDQLEVLYELGLAHLFLDELDQARHNFQRVLAIDSDHVMALTQLAHVSAVEGDTIRAADLCKQVLFLTTINSAPVSALPHPLLQDRVLAESHRNQAGQKHGIPIVLIHRNMFLDPILATSIEYSLAQARKSNPASEIYLIGDGTVRYDFVNLEFMVDYYSDAHRFGELYKHVSKSVRYDYLLLCFQRWFILKEFMLKNGLEQCIHIDSDVMLFTDITDFDRRSGRFDFKMSAHPDFGVSGHYNIVGRYEALESFCAFLLDVYANPPQENEISAMKHAVWHTRAGYVTDMMAFEESQRRGLCTMLDLSDTFDNSTFDANINSSDGFETRGGMKSIYWRNDKAFCRQVNSGHEVRFHALHFNARSKEFMYNAFLHRPLDSPPDVEQEL